MPKSRISLSDLKISNLRSRGSMAFHATLCFDGVPVCRVANDGRGGMTRSLPLKGRSIYDVSGDLAPIMEHMKTLPPVEIEGQSMPRTLDYEIEEALAEFQERQAFARKLKHTCFFTVHGKAGVFEVTGNLPPARVAAFMVYHDVDKFLNALPFEEAFEIYAANVRRT